MVGGESKYMRKKCDITKAAKDWLGPSKFVISSLVLEVPGKRGPNLKPS